MSAPTAAAVLEHVVRSIVDQPDGVSVEVTEDGDRTRLDVRVGDGDLGRASAGGVALRPAFAR